MLDNQLEETMSLASVPGDDVGQVSEKLLAIDAIEVLKGSIAASVGTRIVRSGSFIESQH
jgi:hypothetical protein